METVLQPDNIKAKILAAVARGSALSEAAKEIGLTGSQARSAVSILCRKENLSSEISEIRNNPDKYLALALRITNTPQYALREELRRRIFNNLRLKSADEITPKYVSNLTAAMILEAGITEVGLSEIQEWLVTNGTSLKKRAPETQHMSLVKRAIFLLDSFGFDTETVRNQLSGLDG